jgi:hypothetical protein
MKLCKQTMINSYNWTSFSPEKRGESDFNYYTELLQNDLKELGENQGNYKEKFIDKVMTIFARQSRCASPMIAGPANFNFRRNSKLWQSRDNALQEFDHWRTKYFKSVNRVRTLSPEAEIDYTLEQIERLEARREAYKQANKLKTLEERIDYLKEHYKFTDREESYLTYGGGKFPRFCINSITTKIRERTKKLEVMRNRIETKESFKPIEFNGGKAIIDNDRLVLLFNDIPAKEVREVVKSHGFKYSPKTQTWVRKHTENAIYSLQKYVLPKLGAI